MKPIITCACGCGQTGPHAARGLLETCYRRALELGEHTRYPKRPVDAQTRQRLNDNLRRVHHQRRAARVEDYAELRSWGCTRAEAAERLGVSGRTTVRWNRTLREQGRRDRWLYDQIPPHYLNRILDEQKEAQAA